MSVYGKLINYERIGNIVEAIKMLKLRRPRTRGSSRSPWRCTARGGHGKGWFWRVMRRRSGRCWRYLGPTAVHWVFFVWGECVQVFKLIKLKLFFINRKPKIARNTWPWIWKWNVTSVVAPPWPSSAGVESKVGPNTVAMLFKSILLLGSEATILKWLNRAWSEPWLALGKRSRRWIIFI